MSTVVTQPDGTPKFAGMSGFMLDLLTESMGFKYVINLPPDYSWGARDVHGKWAGQFGMVVRNESDLLVGPVAPTADRASALEPMPQFYYSQAVHCGGLTNPYVTNVFGYVNSFDVDVWLGLFVAMLLVSFVEALISAKFQWSRLVVAYYFAFLSLFSIFLMEASPRVTRGSAKRWLYGTWWLAVFVMAAGFTGHMKASLTMKDPSPRLETLQDIMRNKEVVPVIILGSTFEERFRHSVDIYQRQVWAKARRMGSIIPAREVFSKATFDDVLQSKKLYECWEKGQQPLTWEYSEVTMILKQNMFILLENIRHNSLTSCAGKLFEQVVRGLHTLRLDDKWLDPDTAIASLSLPYTHAMPPPLTKVDLGDHLCKKSTSSSLVSTSRAHWTLQATKAHYILAAAQRSTAMFVRSSSDVRRRKKLKLPNRGTQQGFVVSTFLAEI
ncbi:hypothetical protein HPB52_012202 [Rhipicephalus sanguineus]|uniref:Ionotropic glutamate receptor L-glutamate and glycine-binding domain-containing protein n=1 Tax=Rhipicephalus sanguineus TaxID=34632 RepID=A0A9D4SX51_RHISA|nr:hypothetical protein HPB52_012202 [Rhipicephalus sanguineus]